MSTTVSTTVSTTQSARPYHIYLARRGKRFSLVFHDPIDGEVWLHEHENKGTIFSAGPQASDEVVRALMTKHVAPFTQRWMAEREVRMSGWPRPERLRRWDVEAPATSGRWYKK